jgi:hypothetical protein
VPPTFDATRLQQAILGFRSPVQQVSEPSLPAFGTTFFFYFADKTKENKMGGTRDRHGREHKRVQGFGGKIRMKYSVYTKTQLRAPDCV